MCLPDVAQRGELTSRTVALTIWLDQSFERQVVETARGNDDEAVLALDVVGCGLDEHAIEFLRQPTM